MPLKNFKKVLLQKCYLSYKNVAKKKNRVNSNPF